MAMKRDVEGLEKALSEYWQWLVVDTATGRIVYGTYSKPNWVYSHKGQIRLLTEDYVKVTAPVRKEVVPFTVSDFAETVDFDRLLRLANVDVHKM